MKNFLPEGRLLMKESNRAALKSPSSIKDAMKNGTVLEARATLCDSEHNLHIDLGCMRGLIPRDEGAITLDGSPVKDIALISRVNKPVCFVVEGFDHIGGEAVAILSRRAVQEECRDRYIDKLSAGDIIDARVTHFEPFGAFLDIGAGIPSLIPIDAISVSRISHPSDRFCIGDDIKAIVKSTDDNKISLTHKELLGTWEQNAENFHVGDTVSGIVRSVESYGIFVELAPNFAGLAEPKEGVCAGMNASVYIKSIIPEKMKVKLVIIDTFPGENQVAEPKYFYEGNRIDRFRYSPASCNRVIETVFD